MKYPFLLTIQEINTAVNKRNKEELLELLLANSEGRERYIRKIVRWEAKRDREIDRLEKLD